MTQHGGRSLYGSTLKILDDDAVKFPAIGITMIDAGQRCAEGGKIVTKHGGRSLYGSTLKILDDDAVKFPAIGITIIDACQKCAQVEKL